ncbi:MAG: copper homeostasis protein CutC [Barnesiella sp.]|nr:copper homeostasis protein CutC [Barnesiella sp.]MBD5374445.1 copper homeostasis protein CutC [Bacteroides sp.]
MSTTKQQPLLEVCAGDLESVRAAAEGGAARVELCSALGEGGVTPSIGFLRQALLVPGLRVHVLIRPRGGDFLYTPEEVNAMVADIEACREAGAHGVVIGALTPDGDIDLPSCRRMIEAAGEMSVTFHRAFDLCRNPEEALDTIIELGCDRLLTSGQAATALEGTPLLRRLHDRAAGRLVILAGGGVTPDNAADILIGSGTNEVHASARAGVTSPMRYRKEGVAMGAPGSDEYSRKVTSPAIVAKIVENITAL